MVTVTARLPYGTLARLETARTVFAAERRRAQQMAARPRWSTHGLTGRQAVERRAEWVEFRGELRATGMLLDTRDGAASAGVRAELERRGWNRQWPPLPAEALLPGRWPGHRDASAPEKFSVRLPAELIDTARRACWHTSADAIGRLRDWRDTWPATLPGKPGRTEAEETALTTYRELSAQVTTTGEVWRGGILYALDLIEGRRRMLKRRNRSGLLHPIRIPKDLLDGRRGAEDGRETAPEN
ncbi:hypothetical protein ABZW18_26040 [Streptomyces sp. NPDC004647]|uniref:hypothetical protein n=1 Tax=Streptomyces sp. NPDC004647 TaxID=3154671 RepID=UPI0033B661E2